MKHIILAAAFALTAMTPALALDYRPAMQGYLSDTILPWAQDPALIDAITAQNTAHANMTQARIDALDAQWRAEVGTGSTPMIDPVLTSAAANFLRDQVAASQGVITEIFITDMHGLNVAASHVTSDYWQGDEAKFTQTYPVGPDAVHYGDIEFDESTQTYQAQLSITIADPDSGAPIGSMTVGLVADALM